MSWYQFRLQQLFAATWFVACWLVVKPHGTIASISFGCPLAFYGCCLITKKSTGFWTRYFWKKTSSILLAICSVGTVVLVLLWIGIPTNTVTWMFLIGCPLWVVSLLGVVSCKPFKNCIVAGGALLLYLVIIVNRSWATIDVQNGRYGTELRLHRSLHFARDGSNTNIIRHYVGSRPAQWLRQRPLDGSRDGDDRVNSCSVVFKPFLTEILKLLPSDIVRRKVLECLTDSTNLARIHQGMILACLYAKGFPSGFNSESWWKMHASLFKPVHDPDQTALLCWRWCERSKRCIPGYANGASEPIEENKPVLSPRKAAEFQQQSIWGGDEELYEAFEKLEKKLGSPRVSEELKASLGVYQIAWWPDDIRAK